MQSRNTKQRQLILEILQGTNSHPTADWVYQRVRDKMPNVSLGTVYRNLGLLKQQHIIQELPQAGGQGRYDGNPRLHYHFYCLNCSRVADVPMPYSTDLDRNAEQNLSGYKLLGHSTEFYGLCPECKNCRAEGGDK